MEKIQCRLKVSIYKQIQHLLNLYPKTEWSGVAFYDKLNEDKHGWCTKWELVAFYPIDLGSTSATEFSGEETEEEKEEETEEETEEEWDGRPQRPADEEEDDDAIPIDPGYGRP